MKTLTELRTEYRAFSAAAEHFPAGSKHKAYTFIMNEMHMVLSAIRRWEFTEAADDEKRIEIGSMVWFTADAIADMHPARKKWFEYFVQRYAKDHPNDIIKVGVTRISDTAMVYLAGWDAPVDYLSLYKIQ